MTSLYLLQSHCKSLSSFTGLHRSLYFINKEFLEGIYFKILIQSKP